MSLYERIAARPGGLADLAAARLRRRVLIVVNNAQDGLTLRRWADLSGLRVRRVRRILSGERQPTVNELAALLHAAGYEAEITVVPAGELRRRELEESA